MAPGGPCCQLLGVKHLPDLREREAEQLLQLLDAFNPLESGFVSREPGEDLRAVRISITRPGEEAVTRLLAAGQRILREVLAGWDAVDRDELSRLMMRFADDFATYLRGQPSNAHLTGVDR